MARFEAVGYGAMHVLSHCWPSQASKSAASGLSPATRSMVPLVIELKTASGLRCITSRSHAARRSTFLCAVVLPGYARAMLSSHVRKSCRVYRLEQCSSRTTSRCRVWTFVAFVYQERALFADAPIKVMRHGRTDKRCHIGELDTCAQWIAHKYYVCVAYQFLRLLHVRNRERTEASRS